MYDKAFALFLRQGFPVFRYIPYPIYVLLDKDGNWSVSTSPFFKHFQMSVELVSDINKQVQMYLAEAEFQMLLRERK